MTAKGFDTDNSFMLVEIVKDDMHFETISRKAQVVDAGVIPRREVDSDELARVNLLRRAGGRPRRSAACSRARHADGTRPAPSAAPAAAARRTAAASGLNGAAHRRRPGSPSSPVASTAVMFLRRSTTMGGSKATVAERRVELVGRSEQEWPLDAEDRDVVGNAPPWSVCSWPRSSR